MSNDIANIPLPTPPAPVSVQASGASATSSQTNAQSQTNTQANNSAADAQTSRTANAGRNNVPAAANNGKDSGRHFDKILAAHQQSNAPASQAKPTSGKSSANKNDANDDDNSNTVATASTDNSNTSNNTTTTIAAFVLAQIQNNDSSTTDDSQNQDEVLAALTDIESGQNVPAQNTQAQPAVPAQTDSPLAQLEQLLQQLLAAVQQQAAATSTQSQSTDASDTQQTSDASATDTTTKDASAKSSDSLSQALTQLLALLNQATTAAQAPAQSASTSSTGKDKDIVLGDAPSSLKTLLDQLAKTLNSKLNVTQDNKTAAAATDKSSVLDNALKALTATQTADSSKFSSLLTTLEQTNTAKDDVSTSISDIVNLLASSAAGKSDLLDDSSDKSQARTDAVNNNTPANPFAAPINTANQPQPTDFTKFLSANSHAPAADQVLVQIRNAAAQGESQIKIQLEPANLGKVMVQMNTGSDGKTGITITADNRQTLSMLQNESRSLSEALRNIGIKTDAGGLSFNLRGDQQNQQNTFAKQSGGYTHVAAIGSDDDSNYYNAGTQLYRMSAQSGLDIRV